MSVVSRRGVLALGAGTLAVIVAAVFQPSGAGRSLPGGGPAPGHDPVAVSGGTRVPERAPLRLSQTGLYAADGTVDPRNRPYVPQYPLWTDGAVKSRWVRLPEAETIDTSDVDAWRFPPGTVFWKEFAWAGRRVETRMMRVEPDGTWTFATYVWTEDQGDAVLAPQDGIPAAHEIAPGARHSIPGVADCRACHGSSPGQVLGFTALQLSDDRDPLAPHAESAAPGAVTLRTLVDEGRLWPDRSELAVRPPRIRAADPVARAAMGYLSANCGGCHNDRGPLARLGLSLLHETAAGPGLPEPALISTVDAPGRFKIPGVDPAACRQVAPGAPERSALLHRMQSRRASSQMPPLGSVLPDDEAIGLVRRWIESLDPENAARQGAAHAAAGATGTPDSDDPRTPPS